MCIRDRLRTELEDNLILARGYEGCVLLLDKVRWDQLLAVIGKEPILNLSVRDTFRFIIAGAFEVELDKQGRLVAVSYTHLDVYKRQACAIAQFCVVGILGAMAADNIIPP